MEAIKRIVHGLKPWGISVGGGSLVLAMVLIMNSEVHRPAIDQSIQPMAISLAVTPTQKPRSRPTERNRNRPQAQQPRIHQLSPTMSSNLNTLSGLALAMPGYGERLLKEGAQSISSAQAATGMIMTEEAVDHPPRPLARTTPPFPPRARQKGISGKVTLSLLVDTEGAVEKVKLLEASPEGVFEQAAMEAVRQWRFEPATYKGQQVKVWVRQVLYFELG
jgi:protein TonB